MSSSMQGMDTEQGREYGNNMCQQAGQVSGMVGSITAMIQGLKWEGSDSRAFADDWHGSFAPQANNASQTLEEQGRCLLTHAENQDSASS